MIKASIWLAVVLILVARWGADDPDPPEPRRRSKSTSDASQKRNP